LGNLKPEKNLEQKYLDANSCNSDFQEISKIICNTVKKEIH